MARYSTGDDVQWTWGSGTGSRTVQETVTERVTRTSWLSESARDASDDEPTCLVEQEDGDRVLTSKTELSKA